VTITVNIQTSLSTDGLSDTIGSEISFHTNKQNFIDGLNDEVDSCNGTIEPTPSPTLRPSARPTSQPLARASFTFTDDIDYNSTCIDTVLTKLIDESVLEILGCTEGGDSCDFFEITTSTDIFGNLNCSEGLPCGLAFFNVALSYPSDVTEDSVRNLISSGFLELTNNDRYEDTLLGKNDEELCI
jgi:hypothetical protein